MSLVNSARSFFGLTSPPLRPEFTLSDRGPRMPVCRACGALVAFEGQDGHIAWHADPGRPDSNAR
ncbi:hypothetical protein [Ornithinimicrobium faecis]|uniref:Uncharacterized protein n=1 Tax=Ornithinimicrobium faecis TaxID=2934158 RepID=A0ABY4YQI9_9MICO|nr:MULTISPECIES: hypothetical protein [unclassified Ornithinimicrobium]USQ79042.1 hypothetical protein NF556_15640 [Ornithinimicrobium sp. HY1793]